MTVNFGLLIQLDEVGKIDRCVGFFVCVLVNNQHNNFYVSLKNLNSVLSEHRSWFASNDNYNFAPHQKLSMF